MRFTFNNSDFTWFGWSFFYYVFWKYETRLQLFDNIKNIFTINYNLITHLSHFIFKKLYIIVIYLQIILQIIINCIIITHIFTKYCENIDKFINDYEN